MTERHAAALARVAEMAERLAAKHAERALETDDRRRQLSATLERLIRNDPGTSGDAEHLCDELDDLLDAEELTETFLTEDLTAQITRLCNDLGLKGFEVLAVLPSHCHPGMGAAHIRDP